MVLQSLEKVEGNAETRNQILCSLQEAYGAEKVFEWGTSIVASLQQADLLQCGMHESSVSVKTENRNKLDDSTLPCPTVVAEWLLRDMREQSERGCSSQGRESAEQRFEQSPKIVPELSYQDASSGKALFDMWSKGQGLWLLREALSEIQKIRQSIDCIWTGGDGMNGVSSVVRRLTPL